MDEMLAHPVNPSSQAFLDSHLGPIKAAMEALATATDPSGDDWDLCVDAANMTESFLILGLFADPHGLLKDAVKALAIAAQKYRKAGRIRLDGPGLAATRNLVETYCELVPQIAERDVIKAIRHTTKRLMDVRSGKRLSHDIQVVSV